MESSNAKDLIRSNRVLKNRAIQVCLLDSTNNTITQHKAGITINIIS